MCVKTIFSIKFTKKNKKEQKSKKSIFFRKFIFLSHPFDLSHLFRQIALSEVAFVWPLFQWEIEKKIKPILNKKNDLRTDSRLRH